MKQERYEHELRALQIELGVMQQAVRDLGRRVVIVFEGRDAAGKGGTIRRFTENLSPREHRIVALAKPTELERGQWYFQRYLEQFPNAGEVVFFDRSWYNRAVVEPVMGFCKPREYRQFMATVNEFENLLAGDGVEFVKLWLAITKSEQKHRFKDRESDPLRAWKISPIDKSAQVKWGQFTKHAESMIRATSSQPVPWTIIRTDDKEVARLESIKTVLHAIPYNDRPKLTSKLLRLDSDVVFPVAPGADPGDI